jgi:hypothetical protein
MPTVCCTPALHRRLFKESSPIKIQNVPPDGILKTVSKF